MKRVLKVLKITTLAILALLVSGVIAVTIRNRIFLGSADDTFTAYLNTHKAILPAGLTPDFWGEDLQHTDIFMMGEIHGFAGNQQADQALFLFLHQQAGVRYYLAEMDSLLAGRLNRFLDSKPKDTLLLKEVVQEVGQRIPQQSGRELYEKWSSLYDYNQRQPDSLKMMVIGVDKRVDDPDTTISRDSAMVRNFTRFLETHSLSQAKFYGFFGFFHVLQSHPRQTARPFASRLKHHGFRVTSIGSYTLDSEMYMPKGLGVPVPENERIPIANADGPFMLVKGINDLQAASSPNSITLFRLNAGNSPYRQGQKLLYTKANVLGSSLVPENDGVTTLDGLQYAVLLRNSGPNHRLR